MSFVENFENSKLILKIFDWATETNMIFNSNKFQILRNDKSKLELKR